MINKMVFVAALFASATVQANSAPSFSFVQGSLERVSQSGEESFSDVGLGLKASYQLSHNWFLAADWQRFNDKESEVDSFMNERVESKLDFSLDRYYVGGGYIIPMSDMTNISIGAYLGSYRYSVKGSFKVFANGQLVFSDSGSYSTTDNSIKTEMSIRSNLSHQLELNGKVYYEFVNNSDLEQKNQYGVAIGSVYKLSNQFAISVEASTGKLLDESTTQLALGARYYF